MILREAALKRIEAENGDQTVLSTAHSNTYFMVDKVAVIGLGMIGGSLAKAIKENGFAREVLAYDLQQENLDAGIRLGVIDRGCLEIKDAVIDVDLIVLAVPVKATEKILTLIEPYLLPSTIITDVGSTKGSVISAAINVFGRLPSKFIPGHPIAGSEKSGVSAANSQLFNKHKVIITPHEASCKDATITVARMWQSTGAEVLQMDVKKHDDVLAATSHLPHLLAFSLVDSLAKESQSLDIFRYAAGGFRDFTRIAASDPTMWSDVCGANKTALLNQIDIFTQGLEQLKDAIVSEDDQMIKGVFTRAKAAREHFGKMLAGSAYASNTGQVNVTYVAMPSDKLVGTVQVPGDKSISHRSIILAAIADGVSEITGFLQSEDSMATVQAFRDMGVVIEGPHLNKVKIYGVGKYGLCPPPGVLYLGNSGTTMRLLTGLLSAQSFNTVLSGDMSLNSRPMDRVAAPLREMGAKIETSKEGGAPIHITGCSKLRPIDYVMPIASAQVKSSVLLAALYAQGKSSVTQPALTRDHTEVLMQDLGVALDIDDNKVVIDPQADLQGFELHIPGDLSSAAFFIVGASISEGSHILLKDIGVNPTRLGLIHILKLMGADINLHNQRFEGGESIADIEVHYAPLSGIDIPDEYVSIAIDEFPIIFIAASCAEGETLLKGAEELRHKESDRIAVMVKGLQQLGIEIKEKSDGVSLIGGQFKGATVDSGGDHRTAMAFAMASLRCAENIVILNCSQVATSFPEFIQVSAKAGLKVKKEEANVSK